MCLGIALLAAVVFNALSNDRPDSTTLPPTTPTTNPTVTASSTPTGTKDGAATSSRTDMPSSSPTESDEAGSPTTTGEESNHPPEPPLPAAATVTVTETVQIIRATNDAAGGTGSDLPAIITSVAALITAGVGAATLAVGIKKPAQPPDNP
ncbi:hypothetical protein [Streptomyces sp. NPDC093094]|uniref:hypothetical protein n=1 Tax=Streptomyces sp. NPDC093094 TaxID=3366026 RepID=UPI00382E234C